MYVVEITEDKVDNLLEHMSKGIKCFNKAMECLEEMKEDARMNERYDDDDYDDDEECDCDECQQQKQEYGVKPSGQRYHNQRDAKGRFC